MSLKENIEQVFENIEQSAQRCGRSAEEIKLIAVSKFFSSTEIREAYSLGLRNFGESRPQELRDKTPSLPGDIIWHFIGPLQTNKIKYVVPNAALIHAVDSLNLAQEINVYCQKKNYTARILVEVNTSAEKEKHGLKVDEAVESVLKINELPVLQVDGLMTMAPFSDDESIVRKSFSTLKKIQEKLQKHFDVNHFKTLSMGMSGDYRIAIEEGATMVRIGTAIFGSRRRTL